MREQFGFSAQRADERLQIGRGSHALELLVEKILVERYPDLQRHQVSCHAASVKDERAVPCGRCEKCRRVVSMLVAIGGDPVRCGYSEEQVEPCLAAAAEHGLHQEEEAEKQLMWMLTEQGRLPSDTSAALPGATTGSGGASKGPHPEVLALRFDDKRAPVQSVPNALRRPLYGLMLQHADGAVRKGGRKWVPFDLINDASLSRPYRFEAREKGPDTDPAGAATAATGSAVAIRGTCIIVAPSAASSSDTSAYTRGTP